MSEGAFFCVEGLCKNFGDLAAVSDLSFQVVDRRAESAPIGTLTC